MTAVLLLLAALLLAAGCWPPDGEEAVGSRQTSRVISGPLIVTSIE